MIYLTLFLTFLKIGAVSFGGGYGMISMMREECLLHGWLTEEELLNFIAVAESTPGPIAVNMATFVGASQGELFGSFVATMGVVLPSFIIILLIASLFTRLLKYAGVKAVLIGVRPTIVGLILGTAATMLLSVVFGVKTLETAVGVDYRSLGIFLAIAVLAFGYAKIKKKAFSPILLILISGLLGVLVFGV